ncbi:MAG: membrane dipeptidase [Parvularculaceae bacterium]|nr:membrane dipeptidase [Parvularculaceae bacterium]
MTMFKMNRRDLFAGAAIAGAMAASPGFAKAKKRRFVINALGGLYDPLAEKPTDAQIAAHYVDQRSIDDARKAGVAATNLTLGYVFGDGDPFATTVDDVAWWTQAIRLRPDELSLILAASDIRAAQKQGKAGLIFGFQSTEMFEGDAARARLFSDLGVRVVQLTYNLKSAVGDGALVPENGGLTEFGHDLVAALNAQNLLVDLSHGGQRLTLDAIAASAAPPAITHSGCAALAPHPRNKTDEEMRALAERGGVMGVYFIPYLTPGRQHMAADIVLHIEHALNVMGEDHVGIGTDRFMTGVDDMDKLSALRRAEIERRKALGVGAPNEDPDLITVAPDLIGPGQFEKLATMLSARGHSDARIDKILGGNFLRLFEEVWGA